MKPQASVHPNYIKAYRLTLVSTVIAMFEPFFIRYPLPPIIVLAACFVNLFVGLLFAYFIKKGNTNVKYVWLILSLLGIFFSLASNIFTVVTEPAIILIRFLSTILSVWIIILLFGASKNTPAEVISDQDLNQ